MKNNIINIVHEYILKSEQISYPLNLKTLKKLYTEQGFSLCAFSESEDIIHKFSLPTKSVKLAFMFVSDDFKHKYVFYRDTLNKSDILFASAYFLGKINLEKLSSGVFPLILDIQKNFDSKDSATKFAIELLAPTPLLKAKNIHSMLQIKNFTGLNNNYCLQIFKNLQLDQKSELSEEVTICISKKVRLNIKMILISTFLLCIIISLLCVMILQNSNSNTDSNPEELMWYVDANNTYHKYSDCSVLYGQVFIKGPVSKSINEIKNECIYCKERRLNKKSNAEE